MRHDDGAFCLVAFPVTGRIGNDGWDLHPVAGGVIDEVTLAERILVDPRTLRTDDGHFGLVDQHVIGRRRIGSRDLKQDAIAICRVVYKCNMLARECRVKTVLNALHFGIKPVGSADWTIITEADQVAEIFCAAREDQARNIEFGMGEHGGITE